MNRYAEMWNQQEEFMKLLCQKRGFPPYPVNLESKEGQKFIKNLTYECMGELFEANQELKNSKSHRVTENHLFNRDAYVEELVDCLHYFFEIAICSGVSQDELYEAYMKKGEKNFQRIENGY